MGVVIDDQEIAMTVLCGLPQKYEHLIVAIDAATDDSGLTLDFVMSRLLQEEKRMIDRGNVKPAVDSALVNKQLSAPHIRKCDQCGRNGHTEDTCCTKQLHLIRKRSPAGTNTAGMVAKSSTVEPTDTDLVTV